MASCDSRSGLEGFRVFGKIQGLRQGLGFLARLKGFQQGAGFLARLRVSSNAEEVKRGTDGQCGVHN